jgi:hypothetical protein
LSELRDAPGLRRFLLSSVSCLLRGQFGCGFGRAVLSVLSVVLFAQEPERIPNHDQRRAHVGEDGHPQGGRAGECEHEERAFQRE